MISIGYVSKLAASFRGLPRLFCAVLLMLLSTSATAAQSLAEIHSSSLNFLKQNLLEQGALLEDIQIKVNQPDKRLRLSQCQQPLVNFLPEYAASSGNTTVGVRCDSPKWQIYLPARVDQLVNVWITQKTIRKGEYVSIEDLQQVKKAKSERVQSIQLEVGSSGVMRASKNIRQGAVITATDLCQICKGDQIELRVKSAALTVKMYGIALKSGLQGDLVTARNNNSKKMVTGKVAAAGILEMTL